MFGGYSRGFCTCKILCNKVGDDLVAWVRNPSFTEGLPVLDLNKALRSSQRLGRVALVASTVGTRPPRDRIAEDVVHELLDGFGFSPKVLALHLRVQQSTISRWRSGQSAPSAQSKHKLLALRERLDREGVEFVKAKLEEGLSRRTGISPREIEAIAVSIYVGMKRFVKERREGIATLALRLVQGVSRCVLSIVPSSEE
jgi:transcriptional regulator with XRE-family HTH domain